MPPLIAITASPTVEGRPRVQLNASYVHAIEQAGGVPLLVPAQFTLESLNGLMSVAQGLVLTGGGDVNPARYGEEPDPSVAGVSDERDSLEEAAVNLALDRRLPVLAICRGMQILNVALGGSLVQDIPTGWKNPLVHGPRAEHPVAFASESQLASLVETERADVNSRHHQAIKQPGIGLHVVAKAPDGIIEGLEMPGHWVLGVQWHPEDMVDDSDVARRLFAGIVDAARDR